MTSGSQSRPKVEWERLRGPHPSMPDSSSFANFVRDQPRVFGVFLKSNPRSETVEPSAKPLTPLTFSKIFCEEVWPGSGLHPLR